MLDSSSDYRVAPVPIMELPDSGQARAVAEYTLLETAIAYGIRSGNAPSWRVVIALHSRRGVQV
ncbi:hypothetical protein [uncultured Nitratireductor sp.]|uniref:hypothetical protein n=1 Tax=uncultured Nitratireductor sp. TaxID=520953 RepID=UPI0025F5997A|nr:hypothetical protein [uncultured Nitratireductor sp.]